MGRPLTKLSETSYSSPASVPQVRLGYTASRRCIELANDPSRIQLRKDMHEHCKHNTYSIVQIFDEMEKLINIDRRFGRRRIQLEVGAYSESKIFKNYLSL